MSYFLILKRIKFILYAESEHGEGTRGRGWGRLMTQMVSILKGWAEPSRNVLQSSGAHPCTS